ncbi:MAG TPA: response regulator [Thermoanaerobaculia bacterium]
MHILLIDDDAPVRQLLSAVLQCFGATVSCAADGEEALARLRCEDFDGVILDLMIPGPNGFDVLREMRSISGSLPGKTVVVTAMSDQTLQFFDTTPVRALLHKPVDVGMLVDALAPLREAGSPPLSLVDVDARVQA